MSQINMATQGVKTSSVSRRNTRNPLSFPFGFERSVSREVDRSHNYSLSESDRLQDLSDAVRDSGSVAPANCWLVVEEERKGSRTYRRARLYVQSIGFPASEMFAASKKVKRRSLGRPNCAQHINWQKRIQRRVALYEIEQQMTPLTELIDRQATCPIEFQIDLKETDL
jgi:hypothetical protein